MRVASIQFCPVFKQPATNLKIALGLVLEAIHSKAELICLPELCTTGYSFMSVQDAEPYAEVLTLEESRSMQVFTTLAERHNVAIAWGVMEKDLGTGNLHNSQMIVMPGGRYASVRKLNKWGNDHLWVTPGPASPPIVSWQGKKVGLLICKDIRDKSEKIADLYEPGDADIVAYSANFGRGEFPAGKWIEFAKSNRVWLVVSNRYGEEAHNDFGHGGICVIEPSGKVHIDGLKFDSSCIVYAEVP
jgi:predicted amidohydrolase